MHSSWTEYSESTLRIKCTSSISPRYGRRREEYGRERKYRSSWWLNLLHCRFGVCRRSIWQSRSSLAVLWLIPIHSDLIEYSEHFRIFLPSKPISIVLRDQHMHLSLIAPFGFPLRWLNQFNPFHHVHNSEIDLLPLLSRVGNELVRLREEEINVASVQNSLLLLNALH